MRGIRQRQEGVRFQSPFSAAPSFSRLRGSARDEGEPSVAFGYFSYQEVSPEQDSGLAMALAQPCDACSSAASQISMTLSLRQASLDDRPAISRLIERSARGLSADCYNAEQIEAALAHVSA